MSWVREGTIWKKKGMVDLTPTPVRTRRPSTPDQTPENVGATNQPPPGARLDRPEKRTRFPTSLEPRALDLEDTIVEADTNGNHNDIIAFLRWSGYVIPKPHQDAELLPQRQQQQEGSGQVQANSERKLLHIALESWGDDTGWDNEQQAEKYRVWAMQSFLKDITSSLRGSFSAWKSEAKIEASKRPKAFEADHPKEQNDQNEQPPRPPRRQRGGRGGRKKKDKKVRKDSTW